MKRPKLVADVNKTYKAKFRAASICCDILRKSLNGRYICFGALMIYNDPALENAISAVFSIMATISCREIIVRY